MTRTNIEAKKFVVEEIKKIKTLTKENSVKVYYGQNKLKKKAKFTHLSGKGYFVNTEERTALFPEVGVDCRFLIDTNEYKLEVTQSYVNSMGDNTKVKIESFQEIKYNERSKYYCRKIIPLEHRLKFSEFVDESVYSSNDNWRRRGILNITISDFDFHIYVIDDKLFIDCQQKMPPNDFSDLAWSVLVGIGYITGYLPQGEEFSFFYKRKQMDEITTFKYRSLRPTLKTPYTPINSNPFAWIWDYDTAKAYHYKIDNLNFEQLSTLCQIIHDSNDIKALLLLFTESLKSSMLMMPVGLCVVLEGLSEYVYDKKSAIMKPISDRAKADSFRKQLLDILSSYEKEPSFQHGYAIIKNKIFEINRPTNREKLKSPFTQYGIEITQMDDEVLDYRNEYLHGNITLKPRKGKKFNMDTFEVCLRLMTLINSSLMKMIGYNGLVLNHVKIQKQNSKEIAEDFYKSLASDTK